ncbi:porin family protein [Aminobacter anthyllidis]|uniref:outer membrane protein n=1 Tax=Aminobacter anthyllidis TaxID=1035067 RepID=UPI0024543829|nr:porin family protein [Aminobacter anthyllidis]MDH4986161.1 porin family protein [Aminobacter anthyllidis]
MQRSSFNSALPILRVARAVSLLPVICSTLVAASTASATDTSGFVWTGGYVGIQAGYSWADSTLTYFDTVDGYTPNYYAELKPSGFMGGLYAGYNRQFSSNLLLGVEADIQAGGADSSPVSGRLRGGGEDSIYTYTSKLDWSASLRARMGYAAGRFLPYVTAGLSAAQFEISRTAVHPYGPMAASDVYAGWSVGAGLEFAATDAIVLRTEYRYSDYGHENLDVVDYLLPTSALRTHDVRIGLAYKF